MSNKMSLVHRLSREDAGKNGKHNSRNGKGLNRSHVDKEKSKYNWYWNCLDKEWRRNDNFEEMEKEYYNKRFGYSLKEQNKRHKKNGHSERCKTMSEFRKGRTTKPEEELIQIGDKDNTVSAEVLLEVFKDYIDWHNKEFPEVKFLNVSLHVDEDCAPHIHTRRLWEIEKNDGTVEICEKEVLRRHNIELFDPNQEEKQYNNRKMTYTKMTRDKLLEICLQHGLDVETEVKDGKAKHLQPDAYKVKRKLEEEIKEATDELNAIEINLDVAQRERLHLQSGVEQLSMDLINLHMLMIDNKVSNKLRAEQFEVTYNNYCKLRDRAKQSGLMDDKDKDKLEDIHKFLNTTYDYIHGYNQGSYFEDPFINEYFIEKHKDDFELFCKLMDEKKKLEDEKYAKETQDLLMKLDQSVSPEQSDDDDIDEMLF